MVVGEDGIDERLVGDVAADECPILADGVELGEALVFEANVVVVGDGVDADDVGLGEVGEESLGEVAADEAGGSGDEYGFRLML